MPRKAQQMQKKYFWLLSSHGDSLVFCVWSLTPLSCLFLVSALPLCHWQGVEKLVHYFSDKAWYSTISDFSYHLPYNHIFVFCFPVCMMHVSLHEHRGMLHTDGSISIFLLTFKINFMLINLYVPRKQFLGNAFVCYVVAVVTFQNMYCFLP